MIMSAFEKPYITFKLCDILFDRCNFFVNCAKIIAHQDMLIFVFYHFISIGKSQLPTSIILSGEMKMAELSIWVHIYLTTSTNTYHKNHRLELTKNIRFDLVFCYPDEKLIVFF